MSKISIAIADSPFSSLAPTERVFQKLGAEISLAADSSREAILKVAHDSDALMVTFAKIDAELIRGLKNCRAIGRYGIGVDNIDIKAATAAGIQVCYVPDYCLDEVSDHAMALLLCLVRKVAYGDSLVRAGRWEGRAVAPIGRLRGRTMGVVGLGKIPQALVPKAQAFGLKVIAYDPFIDPDLAASIDVELVEFDELLSRSDYVSVHAPLTPDTNQLFDERAFKLMRNDALLVNTARGPLLNEQALVEALDAGQIAGAALDVLSVEPPTSDCRLLNRDDVILTPHTAYYSEESLAELQTKAAEDVASILRGQAPKYPFNKLSA